MMLPFGFKPDQVFAANLISWLYSYDTRVLTEAKDEAENRCALLHRSNKLLAVALSRDRDRLGVTESWWHCVAGRGFRPGGRSSS